MEMTHECVTGVTVITFAIAGLVILYFNIHRI